MYSTHSFTVFLNLILLLVSVGVAQNTTLTSCLDAAGIRNVVKDDPTWATETSPWAARFQSSINPAAIAHPTTRAQVVAAVACARSAGVKVTTLGGGHSFVASGFGGGGNLVISVEAFQGMSFDKKYNTFTFEGGVRIGPAVKWLWENYGRHNPHPRHGRVGGVGVHHAGYGPTSRFLGTPAANVVGIEIVLYNGSIVHAGKGSDLLWACQGACGSFGVVLSMTVNTWKPTYRTCVNYTLNMGKLSIETGSRAIITIQDWSMTTAPKEFAMRVSLSYPPNREWLASGYFWAKPQDFDQVMAPLLARLPNGTNLTKNEYDFYTMEKYITAGVDEPNGGTSPPRAFYNQALTVTTQNPLTYESVLLLYNTTTYAFVRDGRKDLIRSGQLDLWGGVSSDISDQDTAWAHGNNLWLIRWDLNAANNSLPYPADAVQYAKRQLIPFENYLESKGVALRGFATYRDSELTEEQWSARLYGKNWPRLLNIKAKLDPLGMFTSNKQDIPVKPLKCRETNSG